MCIMREPDCATAKAHAVWLRGADGRTIVSAGSDGRVLMWDVSGVCAAADGGADDVEGGAVFELERPIAGVQHARKVNWVDSCAMGGSASVVCVADVGTEVALYDASGAVRCSLVADGK